MATCQPRHVGSAGIACCSDAAEGARDKTNGGREHVPPVLATNMYITIEAVVLLALDGILAHCDGMMLIEAGMSPNDVMQVRIVRPIVGILSVALLLPQLRTASLNRSRLFGACGLALLAVSRLFMSLSTSQSGLATLPSASFPLTLCISHFACAVASALIQGPTFYGLLMQGPVSLAGWRLNGAAFSFLLAPICGTWICNSLISLSSGPRNAAMLFAIVGTCLCCLHVAVSETIFHEAPNMSGCSKDGSSKAASRGQLYDRPHEATSAKVMALMLAIGLTMITAFLPLLTSLLPALLREGLAGRSILQRLPLYGLCSAAVLLTCGLLFSKRFVTTSCLTGVALAAVTTALGLKAVVDGQHGSRSSEILFGILALQVGSGGYFGIALPQLARIALAKQRETKSHSVADTSCLLVASLFLGHGLEPLMQLLGFYNLPADRALLGLAVFPMILAFALVKFGLSANSRDVPSKALRDIRDFGS